MPQFDVLANPSPAFAATIPYVVDIQADGLRDLPTRVVVPLGRISESVKPTRHLNPTVVVDGETLVMLTDQMAAVAARSLGQPIASLEDRRRDIVAALDFLFTGI